ncbi:MAG: RluA family pseudouridine synthase [Candidatus Amesbacteria bacterium]|nr:RluA family pseudouridine synthase [Candidatus Amesbacteria bacterium]
MNIIFEDEAICVIDKPYGVIVNNANTVKSETIQSWFTSKYNIISGNTEFAQKGGVVHRLDKDTSGVMVLAKTEEAYEKLKLQFLERKTKKTYWALVHGKMSESSGIISAPIDRHPKDSRKFAVSTNLSRTAITEWKVIREFSIFNLQFSLLELSPHTGRTHQLRVHMQHLHHPIVSDPIYGWQKSLADDLKFCPRLFLHAKSLTFIHPISNQEVMYTSELPENLQSMLH